MQELLFLCRTTVVFLCCCWFPVIFFSLLVLLHNKNPSLGFVLSSTLIAAFGVCACVIYAFGDDLAAEFAHKGVGTRAAKTRGSAAATITAAPRTVGRPLPVQPRDVENQLARPITDATGETKVVTAQAFCAEEENQSLVEKGQSHDDGSFHSPLTDADDPSTLPFIDKQKMFEEVAFDKDRQQYIGRTFSEEEMVRAKSYALEDEESQLFQSVTTARDTSEETYEGTCSPKKDKHDNYWMLSPSIGTWCFPRTVVAAAVRVYDTFYDEAYDFDDEARDYSMPSAGLADMIKEVKAANEVPTFFENASQYPGQHDHSRDRNTRLDVNIQSQFRASLETALISGELAKLIQEVADLRSQFAASSDSLNTERNIAATRIQAAHRGRFVRQQQRCMPREFEARLVDSVGETDALDMQGRGRIVALSPATSVSSRCRLEQEYEDCDWTQSHHLQADDLTKDSTVADSAQDKLSLVENREATDRKEEAIVEDTAEIAEWNQDVTERRNIIAATKIQAAQRGRYARQQGRNVRSDFKAGLENHLTAPTNRQVSGDSPHSERSQCSIKTAKCEALPDSLPLSPRTPERPLRNSARHAAGSDYQIILHVQMGP